ncbi:Leucine Rich repeats (2 copies) [compost metagenome]
MRKTNLLLFGFLSFASTMSFALGAPVVTCQSQSSSLQIYQTPFPLMVETIGSKSEQFSISGSASAELHTFFTTGSTAVLSIFSNNQEAYTLTHKNGIPFQKTVRTGWEVKLSCRLPNGKKAYTPPAAPGMADVCDRGAIARAIQEKVASPCDAIPLEKMNKITFLEIRDREFSELPENAFDGLPNLEMLKIDSDKIKLHDDDFILVPKLNKLSILSDIETVSLGSFNGLKNLEFLQLVFKPSTHIDENLFSNLTSLKSLSISGSVKLPNALFKPVAKLLSLAITRNDVESLEEDSLASLRQLSSLTLDSMPMLRNLPSLPNTLSKLIIFDSSVKIPNNTFVGKRIKELWISGANIEMSERWSEGLSFIEELRIVSVPLKNLSSDFLQGMPLLKTVYLERNDIKELPDNLFSGLNNLNKIRIRDNKLKSLPANLFTDLNSLETLDLQGNDLTDNPDFMLKFIKINLPSLKSISLQNNLLGGSGNYFAQQFLQKNNEVQEFCTTNQKNGPLGKSFKDLKNQFPKVNFDCWLL